MSISKDRLDEIQKALSQWELKEGQEKEDKSQWLINQIPTLLEEARTQKQNIALHRIPNSNGIKVLSALTKEAADLMVSLCVTYGTVTWSLMQDTRKTLEDGGGIFFRSEELPEELRPAKLSQPRALPKEEPDALSDFVLTIEGH